LTRLAVAVWLVVAGCAPSPPLAGPRPWGIAAHTARGRLPTSDGPSASCRHTVACYTQCDPISDACLAACDEHGNRSTITSARAILACIAQSGCADQACVDDECATEIDACGQTARRDDQGRRARNTNAPPSLSSS
jgi:hypothetical protein